MLKINWKVKRLVRKENKGINVEKIIIALKNLKFKFKKEEKKKTKTGFPRTAKAQDRSRGL